MRMIKNRSNEDWSIISENGPEEDEVFDEPSLVNAVIDLIRARSGNNEAVAIISAEWERKTETVRSPLNEANPSYRSASDDIIVSVELRLSDWDQRAGDVANLLSLVEAELDTRAEARNAEAIAQLEAEREASLSKVGQLDTRLAELRTGVKLR